MKLLSEYWGGPEYPGRRAEVFHDTDRGCYVVNFYQEKTTEELVASREMITNGTAHRERYAEDAAENYCLGYMQIDLDK